MAQIFASVHIRKESSIESRWSEDENGRYLIVNAGDCTLFLDETSVAKLQAALAIARFQVLNQGPAESGRL